LIKVSRNPTPKESEKISKTSSGQKIFSWSDLLSSFKTKYEPKPEVQALKRIILNFFMSKFNILGKYKAIKSTTISSDGEHSQDDSIIEITSKKPDLKYLKIFIFLRRYLNFF